MTSKSFTIHYTVTPQIMKQASCSWMNEGRSGLQRILRLGLGLVVGAIAIILMNVMVRFSAGDAYTPELSGAAGIGLFFGIGASFLLMRLGQKKVWKLALTHLDRTGEVTAVITSESIRMSDTTVMTEISWAGFDAINTVKEATVLRVGSMQYPIPDAALPEGLTPDAFRAQLQEWKDAKHEVVE